MLMHNVVYKIVILQMSSIHKNYRYRLNHTSYLKILSTVYLLCLQRFTIAGLKKAYRNQSSPFTSSSDGFLSLMVLPSAELEVGLQSSFEPKQQSFKHQRELRHHDPPPTVSSLTVFHWWRIYLLDEQWKSLEV